MTDRVLPSEEIANSIVDLLTRYALAADERERGLLRYRRPHSRGFVVVWVDVNASQYGQKG